MESSKFLRPRLIRIVVLDFTHHVLVYILVLFFYTLHGGLMKTSVNLAVLAVVIFCCVHSGVAGQYRGKCVKKGRTRATRNICNDHRSMFTVESKLSSKGRKKVPKRRVHVKKQLVHLTIKWSQYLIFFQNPFSFVSRIGIARNSFFFSLLYAKHTFRNPSFCFQTLVHAQCLTAVLQSSRF